MGFAFCNSGVLHALHQYVIYGSLLQEYSSQSFVRHGCGVRLTLPRQLDRIEGLEHKTVEEAKRGGWTFRSFANSVLTGSARPRSPNPKTGKGSMVYSVAVLYDLA